VPAHATRPDLGALSPSHRSCARDWNRSRRIQNAANLPRGRTADDGPRMRSKESRSELYGHDEISREGALRQCARSLITSAAGVRDHGHSKRCRSLATVWQHERADHRASRGSRLSARRWLNPSSRDRARERRGRRRPRTPGGQARTDGVDRGRGRAIRSHAKKAAELLQHRASNTPFPGCVRRARPTLAQADTAPPRRRHAGGTAALRIFDRI
jgi:hypothetical protein